MNSSYYISNSILFTIVLFLSLFITVEIVSYFHAYSQEFEDTSNIIRGNIILDNNITPFSGGEVRIYLEDISLQDAPAIPIRERVIKDVSYRQNNDKNNIPFSIDGTVPDITGRYAIRIDIDVNNDGIIGNGDLISTGLYTISNKISDTYTNNELFIEMKEIRGLE
jgi:uncharacterized lipoprotein YbaY